MYDRCCYCGSDCEEEDGGICAACDSIMESLPAEDACDCDDLTAPRCALCERPTLRCGLCAECLRWTPSEWIREAVAA